MAQSAFILFTIIIAILALNVKFSEARDDDPEKPDCLSKSPGEQCNLEVTYPDPVGTVQCDQLVPENQGSYLAKQPSLRVVGVKNLPLQGVLVTFDPDAPVSNDSRDGFVHFIATVTADNNGNVNILREITGYVPPSPPRGHGPHRYQFLLFEKDPNGGVSAPSGRKFQLCSFVLDNGLSQPVAASQYKYERS